MRRAGNLSHGILVPPRGSTPMVAALRGDARRNLNQPADSAAMQGRQHDVAYQRIAIRQMDFHAGAALMDREPKAPRVGNAFQQLLPSGPRIGAHILLERPR